jgi:hypothetical protein
MATRKVPSKKASKARVSRAQATPITVTVLPIGDESLGGANVDLRPHLEEIGRRVGDAFEGLFGEVRRRAGAALPDEFKVKIGLKLEGTTNWVFVKGKTEGSIEVEALWKKM